MWISREKYKKLIENNEVHLNTIGDLQKSIDTLCKDNDNLLKKELELQVKLSEVKLKKYQLETFKDQKVEEVALKYLEGAFNNSILNGDEADHIHEIVDIYLKRIKSYGQEEKTDS